MNQSAVGKLLWNVYGSSVYIFLVICGDSRMLNVDDHSDTIMKTADNASIPNIFVYFRAS